MIFVFPITTPPNTPQSAPLVTTLQLSGGIITEGQLQFPGGVLALCHISIFYGLFQLWPSNQDGTFATNDETILWSDDYPLLQPPFVLTAETWNDDDTYPHTITVRIVISPADQGQTLADQIANTLLQYGVQS